MSKTRILHFVSIAVFLILKIFSNGYENSDVTQLVDKISISSQVLMIISVELFLKDKNKFSNIGKLLYFFSSILSFLLFTFYSESTSIEEDDETFCRIRLFSIFLNQTSFSNKTICGIFEVSSLILFVLLILTNSMVIWYVLKDLVYKKR